MITRGRLMLFLCVYITAGQAAHLPINVTLNTATSRPSTDDDDVQTNPDQSDMGLTENSPLGVLKELVRESSQSRKGFSSAEPDTQVEKTKKLDPGVTWTSNFQEESVNGSGLVLNLAGRGPAVPIETFDPLKASTSDAKKTVFVASSSQNKRRNKGGSEEFLVTYGSLLEDKTTPPPPRPRLVQNLQFRSSGGAQQTVPSPPEGGRVAKQELALLFANSGRGTTTMAPGCSILNFSIKSRCSANVLELTASSRVPVLGKVSLVDGEGQVLMDGAYMVMYAVMVQPLAASGSGWRLGSGLLKADVNKECTVCDNLAIGILLQVGESTCMLGITCQQKGGRIVSFTQAKDRSGGSSNVVSTPAPTPAPATTFSHVSGQDPVNTAKTTISLLHGLDLNGPVVTEVVNLGTKMSLVISVYCKDITLDLHMVKCQAKGDDGLSISLVKDGCSVSQVMGEFREVLGVVHESSFGVTPVRRVTQYAQIEAFNTRTSTQNFTIVCTIKMCSEECPEQPACVHSDVNIGRSKRPIISHFSQVVTLGKTFVVAGLSSSPSSEEASNILKSKAASGATSDTISAVGAKCMSFNHVYILVGILSGLYLAILGLALYCVHRSTTRTVVRSCMEDYESPKRAFYPEYSSPRKRSPKASPEYSTFTMNADECGSPRNYRK
ncbi:uncharacterized protein [Procambarus clarkii]|uniref:uncharacterized protein isoform X1 n=1 Tax=Procambarus clarkii TaxID=6728 RepID=UPI003742C9B4